MQLPMRKGSSWKDYFGPEEIAERKYKMSQRMKGENNPMAGRKRPDQVGDLNPSRRADVRLKISQKMKGRIILPEWREKLSRARKGRKLTEENRRAIVEAIKKRDINGDKNPAKRLEVRAKMRGPRPHVAGERNPNWKNGISYEPYDPRFNTEFKKSILDRDGHRCQFPDCGAITDLKIHHIDYDKSNTSGDNCITLCRKHNSVVNFDRERWKRLFQRQLIS